MAELVEYKPGTPFPGVIGRTVDESSPAWPSPSRAKEGSPNVVFIVMDDTVVRAGAIIRRAILDKSVEVKDGARLGVDPEGDAERFTVSGNGIVAVARIGTLLRVSPPPASVNRYRVDGVLHSPIQSRSQCVWT